MLIEDLKENLEIENLGQTLILEKFGRIIYITKRLANDLRKFFGYFDYISIYIKSPNAFFYKTLNQTLIFVISPKIIVTITITVIAVIKN